MKRKPSQLELFQRHPQDHPRIEWVNRTRKVIYANFRANRAEVDFCDRFKAESLSEAVKNPDAAIDFLSGIEVFESKDPSYLNVPVKNAVRACKGATCLFVENLGIFAQVMKEEDLMEALVIALGMERRAAYFFIAHKKDFEKVSYLRKENLDRALEIAGRKMKA